MNDQTKQYIAQYGGSQSASALLAKQAKLDEIRNRKEFSRGMSDFANLFRSHRDTDIHFLIDGSGSMDSKGTGAAHTPLNDALTVAYVAMRGAQDVIPRYSRAQKGDSFATITTTLYGNNANPTVQFSLEDSRIDQVQNFFNAAGEGLHSGSDLDNELDALSDLMADIAPERKQEIVILTDGDMYGYKQATEKLAILKELHPNANISIYSLSERRETAAGKLADALAARGIDTDYQTQMTTQDVMDALAAKISGAAAPDRKLKGVLNAASEVRTAFTDLAKKMEKLEDRIAAYEGKKPKNRTNGGFSSLNRQGYKF